MRIKANKLDFKYLQVDKNSTWSIYSNNEQIVVIIIIIGQLFKV